MELNSLISLLPFAFSLHNFEEVFGMEKWSKSTPSLIHKPVTTRQFGVAVLLFSILGFIIVFAKNFYPSEKYFSLVITGFSGMIFLNVFLPHLLSTIILRKYSPGVITGILINLPLSWLILSKIKSSEILTMKQILIAIVAGGLIGICLAFLLLKIGKFVDNIFNPKTLNV